jgi:hypothetical protein
MLRDLTKPVGVFEIKTHADLAQPFEKGMLLRGLLFGDYELLVALGQ